MQRGIQLSDRDRQATVINIKCREKKKTKMNEVCQKPERETVYPQGIVHFANPVPTMNDIEVINFDVLSFNENLLPLS